MFVAVMEEPEFTDVIENVTVPAGRSVRLACSVKNLGSYKVKNNTYVLTYLTYNIYGIIHTCAACISSQKYCFHKHILVINVKWSVFN